MPKKKYKKPENKNRKRTHNRPYHGLWWEYGKECHKAMRKYMKALRHKLLFHIPLSDEEKNAVEFHRLTEHSQIDRQGYVRDELHKGSDKWRYENPKEIKTNYK